MAVPVVVAAASQAKDSSFLNTALKWLVTLLFIGIFVGLVIALYLLIDNWEPIVMFFTTGFIGWLNPFDSPEGDLALGNAGSVIFSPFRLITSPFRFIGSWFS